MIRDCLVRLMMGSEKTFENRIKKYLTEHGIWHVKFWGSAMTKAGTPDLLCCCNGHFLAIEVKSEIGKPSALQLHHIEKIKQSGGHALVVKPSQFEELKQLIEELLNE